MSAKHFEIDNNKSCRSFKVETSSSYVNPFLLSTNNFRA